MSVPELVVVIPLNRLVICGEGDHAYDGEAFRTCPNCGSQERVPIENWIGSKREKADAPTSA